jgi:tetratricopeptide (TPR) repeat protein
MAQTLFNYGLLLIEEERYSEAISAFEEAMPIYQILAQNNSAFESIYTVSLYFLAQLYPMTGEHAKHYAVNEKWLPCMKEWYQEDKENHEEDYIDVLGSQSFQCIFMKRFTQAEQYSKEALTIDPSQHWIYTNLAAALLLQGKYDEAEAIYRQYKDELKESFLGDFNDFEAAGIIPEERKADVERIRKMLNE